MRLSDLKITTRLFAGFGTLIVFGMLVAGFGVWELTDIGRQVGRLVSAADDNASVIEVGEHIQSMQHLSLNFKLTSDAAMATQLAKSFAEEKARALELLRGLARGGASDRRRLLDETGEQITAAGNSFDKLQELVGTAKAVRAKDLTLSNEITMALDRLVAAARFDDDMHLVDHARDVELGIAAVRVEFFRFLSSNEAASEARFTAAAEAARAAINTFEAAATDDGVRALAKPMSMLVADFSA